MRTLLCADRKPDPSYGWGGAALSCRYTQEARWNPEPAITHDMSAKRAT